VRQEIRAVKKTRRNPSQRVERRFIVREESETGDEAIDHIASKNPIGASVVVLAEIGLFSRTDYRTSWNLFLAEGLVGRVVLFVFVVVKGRFVAVDDG
jgi:hypothetical protein